MKASGLMVVLAGASVADAFFQSQLFRNPSPASVTLRRLQSCPFDSSRRPTSIQHGVRRPSKSQYMVATATEEGKMAAVPHGGELVDLNLKTDVEKQVRCLAEVWY